MKSSSAPPPYPRKTPKKTPRKPSKLKPTDPVEVFCRIRPLNDNDEETCVEVVSNTTIQLNPPQNSQGFKSGHRVTATQHSFKQVFDEDSNQKTVFNTVALDIVHDLIHGKNGLIFAYGITGSGKTHTMTGEPSDGGLLPRGLDVLFNSIGGFQTKPCVFTPDKSNGMDVQSESDAKLDYDQKQKEIAVLSSLRKNRGDDDITDMVRIPDCYKFDDVDEDNGYAVFVSYVEIYNNFIYDLLEDAKQDFICPKPPVSKQLREDNNRNMYVQGVTEVEVKSTEEAYAMFWKGQKKRRVADTQLNMQSSRSHSVFTLKLVQAPLDPDGESVLLDKDEVRVSTLSMCDLAGSERTNRTKADGDRLKEAGNINKDLMNLRSCLEILRENQANCDGSQTGKMVPYRESRLTHLFKNFFDGEGKVRMLVCLNPSAKEYDESVHVMRFAEITQEVVIARPTGINSNTGLAPGRRKANQMFEETLKNVKDDVAGTAFRQELAKLGSQTAEKDRLIFELQASNIEKEKEIQKLEMFLQKNDALQKMNQQHRNTLAPKALNDFDEKDLGDLNNSGSKKTVAFLKVLAIGEFPETTFPVYEGHNNVGRRTMCHITIPLQVVSKKHACIDVHGKYHLIYDYRSRNKTRINQMFLEPQTFYELVNEIGLMFADVKCQYLFVQTEDVADDSGSETASASESMIPPSVENDELEQDLKDKEEQEELGEKYLEVATQDYSYKNPERNSPIVLCPETDDETDDEKETGTQLAPTMDAAIPCNTLEPDIIPETPVTPETVDFEPLFKLKQSIDVKADTSRRISAVNTLAYGLSNSTRESIDASESGKPIGEAFNEGFAPEPENKLHFEDDADSNFITTRKKVDKHVQVVDAQSSSTRKKPACGQEKTQEKEEEPIDDADNQHDAIVVKRGRKVLGKSAPPTERKKYNLRKRNISVKYTEILEDDGENIETEQVSDSEDNRDTFKLQLSVSESSEMENSTAKSTKAKKVRPRVAANIVEDVDKVEGRNKTTQQENKGPITRGRARKRKYLENLNENEKQQKKDTTKKSRKNATTEEMRTEATSSSHSDKGSVDHSSSVKVIFTGLQDASLVKAKKIVQSLGGKVVEHVEECTHLITDKVRRSVKFLCALSRGVPIVDMSWLDASKKSKSFVASTKFILIDDDAQMKYDFSMERSLQLAKNAGLLSGYKIHVTPHVLPPPDEMKEIIKCAKGEIVSKMPSRDDIDIVIISCEEDKDMFKKANIQTAYTAELLLTGILRQNLDLEQHKLTLDAIPDVNSTAKNKRRRKR